jgi:hypothetical protein
MSLMHETRKESHRAQRQVSGGAGITLVLGCGQLSASFECATRCAEMLGQTYLGEAGDGFLEIIPIFKIPMEDAASCLAKLTARYSVALVDMACGDKNSRFVLVWKIPATPAVTIPEKVSLNLEDY